MPFRRTGVSFIYYWRLKMRAIMPIVAILGLLESSALAQDFTLPQAVSALLPDKVQQQLVQKYAPLFPRPTGEYSHRSESTTQSNGSMERECSATAGGFFFCNDYEYGSQGAARTIRLMLGPIVVAEEIYTESGLSSRITIEEISQPAGRTDTLPPSFLYFSYKNKIQGRASASIVDYSAKCYARDYAMIEVNGEQEIGPRHFMCIQSRRGVGDSFDNSVFLPKIGAFVTPELSDLRRDKNWRVHDLRVTP